MALGGSRVPGALGSIVPDQFATHLSTLDVVWDLAGLDKYSVVIGHGVLLGDDTIEGDSMAFQTGVFCTS